MIPCKHAACIHTLNKYTGAAAVENIVNCLHNLSAIYNFFWVPIKACFVGHFDMRLAW